MVAQTEKITVQLAWKYQFQFAGYIMAKELGFYDKAGLHVELKEYGNLGTDIQEEVLSGRADFGVGRASLLLNWLEKESDIKLLLAAFQSSPLVLLAKQNRDFKTLSDIKGKKLMPLGDLGSFGNMLPILAMLASQGISKKDFEIIDSSFDIPHAIENETDLIAAYASKEPFLLQEAGIKTKMLDPKKYGFHFYSDFLFTSGSFEQKRPDVVKKFRDATIKGWQYALSNIEETADILYKFYNTQNRSLDSLLYEAKVLKDLAQKPNTPFGKIDSVVLRNMFNTMQLLKITKSPIGDYEDIIYSPIPNTNLGLSNKEMEYINTKSRVILGAEIDWRPFSYMDSKGEYNGLASDYIQEISKLTGLQFDIEFGTWSQVYNKLIRGEVDVVANMFYSQERAEKFHFSRSYYEVREYLFTREGVEASSISDLFGKKVAIQKDYETASLLKRLYGSKIDFKEYDTVDNAINALLTYRVDFLYNATAVVQEVLKNRAITNVKPAFQIYEKGRLLHFASKDDDPVLARILSKAIGGIPEAKLQNMASKWIQVNNNKPFDYSFIWKYLIIVIIIVLAIIYKNILLSKVNKRLQEKETLLQEQVKNNERLLEENRRFIADTVHQIRTPLSVIMANSNMIDMHFNNEEISEYVALMNGSINLLSNTYEDLAYMVSSGKVEYTPSRLNLSESLKKRIDFFNTILHVERRQIVSHIDKDLIFNINEIEFERLVDNNLTNALKYGYDDDDIYVTLIQIDKQINFSIKTSSKKIQDTQKIFTQNYRENDSNRGLGLGLSITKGICDKYSIEYRIQTQKDLNIFTYTFYLY